MTDDERIPLAGALGGMGIHPLPDNWTPIEAFVLIKALDEDNDSTWTYRTTHRLNNEELLGVLLVQVELLKRELVDEWTDG